jgi:peptidoglycan/xylan/chitin deacetylase (PgdA/CDA1 family)
MLTSSAGHRAHPSYWPGVALAAPLAGLAALAAAHAGPAATWLPPVRQACFPALAGLGRRDHVALTFDDGPDPRSTPGFLDALDALGVRATFFVLGDSVRAQPGLTRDLRGGGTLLLHDTDATAAPGCWRATLAALPGLVAWCRAAGWAVGPLAEHWGP